MSAFPEVRPSPIAGMWYSANPQELALQVDEFLAAAAPDPVPGRIVALVSPHAGLRYSGRTAAHALPPSRVNLIPQLPLFLPCMIITRLRTSRLPTLPTPHRLGG